jgi:DNA-binding response OmpR family regulator
MITKDSTIFVVEDDKPYGILIQCYLRKLGFQHIFLFHDEKECLDSMDQYPEVLISDYHLNFMSGLKLIQEARKISSGFYSVLLSGAFHKEKYSNDMPLHYIDKYIMKGDNELQKLSETLNTFMNPMYNAQFY